MDYTIYFSLAGATIFAFLRPTVHLFLQPRRHLYYTKGPPSDAKVVAYVVALVIMGGVGTLLVWLSQRIGPSAGLFARRGIQILATGVGVVGLVCVFSFHIKHIWWIFCRKLGRNTALALLLSCVAGSALIFATPIVWALLDRFLVCVAATSPLVAFVVVRHLADRRKSSIVAEKPPRPLSKSSPPGLRVVLLIFDELDARIAFHERPVGLHLPCFDSFMSEAVTCTFAYPPSNSTEISLPAFLTGKLVEETFVSGPVSIDLRFAGNSKYEPFIDQVTLFHRLRARSLNCGAVISYHPIGRLFGDVLADYFWLEGPTQESAIGGSILEMVGGFYRSLLETPKYSIFGSTMIAKVAITHFVQSSAAAMRMAADPKLDVAFLHWTIPHAPYIYDRERKLLRGATTRPRGYLDNLALSDVALGRVRDQLLAADLWEKSVVIVTSDHWWRYAAGFDGKMDRRVPFAVRFPEKQAGLVYEAPFNTIALHDLTLDIVDGVVRSPSDVIPWLRENATNAPPTKM